MIYSKETRKTMLEYRIRVLLSRGEIERMHLIAKLRRELNNLESEVN